MELIKQVLGGCELYNGDCLVVMDALITQGVKVDAIITDPPYGINYQTYRTKREKLKNDNNLEWVDKFTYQCSQILKNGQHLYCFVDPEYSPEFILGFRKYGFKIRNLLTIPRAVKGNGGNRIFQQQNEFCIFATLGKKDEGRNFNETQILKPSECYIKDKRYAAKEFLYRLPDYWHWVKASEHNSKSIYHPTQKSIECLTSMLEISTNPNDVILDPFMGSASTGVACVNTNRCFIGIELDEGYYKISAERVRQMMDEQASRLL